MADWAASAWVIESPRRINPPTRESFHIGRAKAAYVAGTLSVEEFEAAVEHVLRGGYSSEHFKHRMEVMPDESR